MLPAGLTSIGARFGRIARRPDLCVVVKPEAEGTAVEEMIIEGALFGSRWPVIVVPYIQTAPFNLDSFPPDSIR